MPRRRRDDAASAGPSADEIIERAMRDPATYRAMAEQEAAVWSNTLSDPDRDQAVLDDQAAARELRLNRDTLSLREVLRRHGLGPERGLSLGCGAGRAERDLLRQGVCSSFHGIDIADDALAEGRAKAEELGLALTYERQDLNELQLPADSYDLVLAQTSLHHTLQLERVADQVARTLRAGGVLWIHDYVGETQFQFTDARLRVMNDLIDLLPEELRVSAMTGRALGHVPRKPPGTLVSPFESIRSGEIVQVFEERFEIIERHEAAGFLHRVVPVGTRRNYLRNEDTRALFEVLLYFDRLLVESKVLPPALGQYLMRPRGAS